MIFEVDRVTYRYQRQVALNELCLDISEGTRVALVGANGSGKSTLLRLLDGLVFPEAGGIRFRGNELIEEHFADETFAHSFRREVGLIFQNPDVQLFNPTVFDEVAFGPLQMRWRTSEVRERVNEILNRFGILHLRDRIPHRLSGGEKKKVALATVLVLDPAVLLLDEPTAALDPRSQSQFIDLLVQWAGGTKTVITATHDLGDLQDIADRCCVLQAGQVVADRPPADVLRDYDLLQATNLIHEHRHRHHTTAVHSHPHLHPHNTDV
jgi:cobalt/nickel transport system ATP-binding protein